MDLLLSQFNGLGDVLIMIALGWAVLSRRVADGIVIKFGLILMALGYGGKVLVLYDGATCSDLVVLVRTTVMTHIGLAIIAGGYLLRTQVGRVKQRRSTDWVDLDTRPLERDLP